MERLKSIQNQIIESPDLYQKETNQLLQDLKQLQEKNSHQASAVKTTAREFEFRENVIQEVTESVNLYSKQIEEKNGEYESKVDELKVHYNF